MFPKLRGLEWGSLGRALPREKPGDKVRRPTSQGQCLGQMHPVQLLGIPSRRSPIASGSRRASLPQQHGGHGGRAAGGGLRRRAAGFPARPARAVLPALPPGFAGALFFAGDQQVDNCIFCALRAGYVGFLRCGEQR